MLKQYVEDCWADDGEEGQSSNGALLVNNEAKIAIKTILPQGLYDPNSKVRENHSFKGNDEGGGWSKVSIFSTVYIL